jgi:hypothetical protein
MRRKTLGIAAVLLLVVGVVAAVRGPEDGSARGFAGGCIRVGLVLGALWLAWPQIQAIFARLPQRVAGWLLGFWTRRRSPPAQASPTESAQDGESPRPAARPRRRRPG